MCFSCQYIIVSQNHCLYWKWIFYFFTPLSPCPTPSQQTPRHRVFILLINTTNLQHGLDGMQPITKIDEKKYHLFFSHSLSLSMYLVLFQKRKKTKNRRHSTSFYSYNFRTKNEVFIETRQQREEKKKRRESKETHLIRFNYKKIHKQL